MYTEYNSCRFLMLAPTQAVKATSDIGKGRYMFCTGSETRYGIRLGTYVFTSHISTSNSCGGTLSKIWWSN